MRGRLRPSEWRPLMASSLIYNKRLFWTMTEDTAITVIMLVILVIGGIGLFFEILGTPGVLLYLILLFGPFLQYRFSQEKRKLKLKADIEASKPLGSDAYSAVLEKIDALRISDMERRKKRKLSRYFSSSPSLTERIQNLGALRLDQAGPSTHGVKT
jgi:Zn-dependent protease with chaperone function